MGATVEALPAKHPGLRSSAVKRHLSLWARDFRIRVDPDGSVRSFESYSEQRALFGFERPWMYKVQAGVVVQSQKTDWNVRATPRLLQFSGKVFDSLDVVQSIRFLEGPTIGYTRSIRIGNSGQAGVKLRLIGLFDPTAAKVAEVAMGWGSIGLNAFNRDSHVAMDEASDPPSARVIGAVPQPSRFYMTTDRSKAQDLLASGELPEATAGMSGQVIVLSLHDLDLAPGETEEVSFACIYNPAKLEDALSDFRGLQKGGKPSQAVSPSFACSSQELSDAASWASTALEGSGHSLDILDGLECVTATTVVHPSVAKLTLERAKATLRKDGSVAHSLDQLKPGTLETAVMLQGLCRQLVMSQDKKASRSAYPLVRKLALYLMSVSRDFAVRNGSGVPQGWRRRLGRGFPTGEIPEVTLAVAGGLAVASQVASQISKSEDAGKFRERSEMLVEGARKRLEDERGLLALCLDSAGRLRAEETIDMAVAAYRHPFHEPSEQASAHRLMEADFETPYGPRSVPTSNQIYFNRTYGEGQLGGYWTRAALAYAILCYRIGLAGIGSLTLQRVAKFVTDDCVKMRGSTGEFPYWADVEGNEVHGEDTDRVAAARLIEGLVWGEAGLSVSASGASVSPPGASSLTWVAASGIWLGESASVFVGRSAGKSHAFLAASRVQGKGLVRFAKAETLERPAKGVTAVSFHGPAQVVCLGSCAGSQTLARVAFAPRAQELSKKLTTPLEAYEPSSGSWSKVGSLRVLPTMSFEATLAPGDWKAFRVSA